MILESEIREVLEQQYGTLMLKDNGLKRELIPSTGNLSTHAHIISGVRRCGKSTLMRQIIKEFPPEDILFLNFDTPRLFEFSLTDFGRLDRIIQQKGAKVLFFDELLNSLVNSAVLILPSPFKSAALKTLSFRSEDELLFVPLEAVAD